MPVWGIVLLVIIAVLVVALIVLAIIGNKLKKNIFACSGLCCKEFRVRFKFRRCKEEWFRLQPATTPRLHERRLRR